MRFRFAVLLSLCLSQVCAGAGESATRPPNVLFIAIDDLNDWTGTLGGYPGVKTPNLDRLVAQSEEFTRAYCPAPACGPSRTAIMSGLRPSTTGLYSNYGDPEDMRSVPLLKDAVMLPEYFKNHGYYALGSGKIFHRPDAQSWDAYWPSLTDQRPNDPELETTAPGGKGHFNWGPLSNPPEEMGDWQVANWVIEQIKNPPEEPMFLGCGFTRPHLPWAVPQKYFDMYPLESITLPEVNEHDMDDISGLGLTIGVNTDHPRVLKNDAWKEAIQGYLASITFVDECLGRVLDALEQSPLADNTIVVVWSDHGWHLGEKQRWRKFTLWEEAQRSVLVIRAPGVTEPGSRCGATVNLIDLYPTLIQLCGLPPKPGLEGVSMVPLLRDPDATWQPTISTMGEGNHTVRSEQWRYIRYKDGVEELYDHEQDPLEWTNLAVQPGHEAVIADHQQWLPSTNAPRISFKKKAAESD